MSTERRRAPAEVPETGTVEDATISASVAPFCAQHGGERVAGDVPVGPGRLDLVRGGRRAADEREGPTRAWRLPRLGVPTGLSSLAKRSLTSSGADGAGAAGRGTRGVGAAGQGIETYGSVRVREAIP